MPATAAITYCFDGFELDPGKFELRGAGGAIHLEPQVLSLLILLASNPDRLVSKDELIEKIWGGRFISEAAVSARIKSARRALDDDGKQQRFIRTVHGKGFRFVAKVTFVQAGGDQRAAALAPLAAPPLPVVEADGRPSIAVLPFSLTGGGAGMAFVADALADELITDLSRLRWLLVIARGSSFRFREAEIDHREIGGALNVRYCLSGRIEAQDNKLTISVELTRTSDSAVIWAERFASYLDELPDVRRDVVAAILANLELRIPQHEAQQVRGRPADTLDAWSAFHLGLDRMFRFNRADNAHAAQLFERALAQDPDFGRALGGLSFTRFQDAFLQYSPRRDEVAAQARAYAEQALQCDGLDPFAHFNMGRSLWLDGGIAESVERLDMAIGLSPNYAQAIYSKAWAEMTQCNAAASDGDAVLALRLSPLDPLRYAMLAVRSVNAAMRGDYDAAADLGERAARSPGAHKHIAVIAALGTSLAGQADKAAHWTARAQQQDPGLSQAAFLRAFPFAPSAHRETIEATLRGLGL